MGESEPKYVDDHLNIPDRANYENKTCVLHVKQMLHLINRENVREELLAICDVFKLCCTTFAGPPCVEICIDHLIYRAKEHFRKLDLNLSYFLCMFCGKPLNDPITLKCGHTFSKKCLKAEANAGNSYCFRCGQTFDYEYLVELKPNVVLSNLTKHFWNNVQSEGLLADMYDATENQHAASFELSKEKALSLNVIISKSFLENIYSKESIKNGDVLVNFKTCEDFIKMYLFRAILDPHSILDKKKAIEMFYMSLLKSQTSPKTIDSKISVINSSNKRHLHWNSIEMMDSKEHPNLFHTLQSFCTDAGKLLDEKYVERAIASLCLDRQDFQCSVCIKLLLDPITIPCGHTFCRTCLYRCFDHHLDCPLCKTDLDGCLAERVKNVDELIQLVIAKKFPTEYATRVSLYKKEMEEFYNAGKDPSHVIPLFVCTTAFPTIRCPLHVYEPRYRLMIRQCMESGSRKFGMCATVDGDIAEYGTILEIKDVRYFPDGRAVVDTVGTKRFRILKKGERDGYFTASVEYLKDEQRSNIHQTSSMKKQHEKLYEFSERWVQQLPFDTKFQIMQHFGPMPGSECDWLNQPDGPAWFWWMLAILPIETKAQVTILGMTSLMERLKTLEKILGHLDSTSFS